MNATAIMTLSPLAQEVDMAARVYVDRRHFDGRMPSDVAAEVYRNKVADTVRNRMLEESEPIHKAIGRTTLFMFHPQPEIPKEWHDMLKAVEKKWTAVFEELLPPQQAVAQ